MAPTKEGTAKRVAELESERAELRSRITELEAENARLAQELFAVQYAARMPDEYEHGLPSWINQHLYAAYIGVRWSSEVTEQINQGRLTFPESPAHREREFLLSLPCTLGPLTKDRRPQFEQVCAFMAEHGWQLHESKFKHWISFSKGPCYVAWPGEDTDNRLVPVVDFLNKVAECESAAQKKFVSPQAVLLSMRAQEVASDGS